MSHTITYKSNYIHISTDSSGVETFQVQFDGVFDRENCRKTLSAAKRLITKLEKEKKNKDRAEYFRNWAKLMLS